MNLGAITENGAFALAVLVTLGLVEWLKKLNVHGTWLTIASMVIGVLVGGGLFLYHGTEPVPAVVAGVLVGMVASGVYDAVKGIVSRWGL